MFKACSMVPLAYGLGRSLDDTQRIEIIIKWLVMDLKFIHPDINIHVSCISNLKSYWMVWQAMTCDEAKPWQNPIFTNLIQAQWWGPKGDAKRLGTSAENMYSSIPAAMLALVACAVSSPSLFIIFIHIDFWLTQCSRLIVLSVVSSFNVTWTSMKSSIERSRYSFVLLSLYTYFHRWDFYCGLLEEFQQKSPKYLSMVGCKIQESVG